MFRKSRVPLIVLSFMVLFIVQVKAKPSPENPLPSWNETPAKAKIIDFVSCVTDTNCKGYVPPFYRLATFDLDGTVMCEKPDAFQMFPTYEKLVYDVEQDPSKANIQPWKAVMEKDTTYIKSHYDQVLGTAFQGFTQAAFMDSMFWFMSTEMHPRYDVRFLDLIYRPMVELIIYLQQNEFEVYMCSGSMQGFIRSFSKGFLGVGLDHVIGSSTGLMYDEEQSAVVRTSEFFDPVNLKGGKPVNIERWAAKKPIFAFGNSNGDVQMLEYAMSNKYNHMVGIIIHDSEKEYVYRYPDLEEMAQEKGWLEVSMANDFWQIFMVDPE